MNLKIKSVIAAGITAAGIVLGISSPAYAVNGIFTIYNSQTNTCLDSNYQGSVYHIGCNGGTYQRWLMATTTGNTVQLEDTQTGYCLYAGYTSIGGVDQLVSYTATCDVNSQYDLWYRSTANGYNFFYNFAKDACLDAGQGNLLYHGAGGCWATDPWQQWSPV
jgi:hypothetical protein